MDKLFAVFAKMFGKLDSSTFLILIIIGGSKSDLLKLYGRRRNTQVILLDNSTDLENLQDLAKEFGSITIPLGRAQSAASLANQLGGKYVDYVDNFAPTDAKSGFGAAPLIGFMSALVTVVATGIQDLVEHLLGKIRASTNNAPSLVVVRVVGSVDGGTCSGYFRPTIDAFVKTLVRLGVNVQVEMDFVGPNGFSHIDARIPKIAAAVIPFAVATTMDRGPKDQELVTKHLTIGEFPSGLDDRVRGELGLVEEAAVISNEMQKHLQRSRPNHGTSSVYGNVTIRETDHFYGLDLEADILPQVATALLDQLSEALKLISPDLSLISKLNFEERTTRNNNVTDVVTICEELYSRQGKQLLEALRKPFLTQHSSILFELVAGRRFGDVSLSTMFISPVEKLSESVERSILIQTLIARLREERIALRMLSDQITEEVNRHTDLFSQILSTFGNPEDIDGDTQFTKLVHTGMQIRRLSDELELYTSRSYVVRNAQEQLERILAVSEKEFHALADSLKPYQTDGMVQPDVGLIEVMPLEECFPALITVAQKSASIARETHRWCVTSVTERGLAQIVQAQLPTVNSIADQAVYGVPKYKSSPYGGLPYDDAPTTIYTFPLVGDVLRRELRSAIKARDERSEVFFTDTIGVGANVLRFRFRYPKSIEEIMRGTHRRQLRDVLSSPIRQNFFPGETSYIEQAGVIIKGNDFELVNRETLAKASATLTNEGDQS